MSQSTTHNKLLHAYRRAAYKAKDQRLQVMADQAHTQFLQTRASERVIIRGAPPSASALQPTDNSSFPAPTPTVITMKPVVAIPIIPPLAEEK